MTIPWNDHAVASRDGVDGREIVVQGPLHIVVAFLATKSLVEQRRTLIALPDRNAAPRRYDGDRIQSLAAYLHRERRLAGLRNRDSSEAQLPASSL
jgi:hypothetical protein